MKYIILSICLFTTFAKDSTAQILKSKEKSGKIHFFSATPMENIEATSTAANSLINQSNDTIIFKVPITSFQFEKSLMQEHFNENYLESGKYPLATLRGKINEKVDFKKDGVYKVTANCNLYMHGVVKLYIISGTITVKGDEVHLVSKFDAKLADHKIEIPKLVTKNISESIAIDIDFIYLPFVKKQ